MTWRDEALVARMAGQLRHRGPDQEGTYAEDGISLAHRRLSIIDLSDHGRQPMFNEDRSVALVFNGEIYNFQELRDELLAKGHTFASRSDSEVIVHAYEEYGAGCLQRLRGMFAFAIWDRSRRSLLLARDRIGIKPLYFYERGGRLAFASEIKALLEDPAVPRTLNHQAFYDYLGFEFVPAPDTFFEGISKLPAGHCLEWRDGRAEVRPYWDLTFDSAACPRTYDEAVERLRALLEEAVSSHLISDVPLGVFLSGGLDSSAIVAMMRRHITGPLRTFTVGYADKTFSELDYAKRVADTFQTEHHVLMLDDVTPEIVERGLWHLDEPMTDLSAIPLYLACREARKHITVCLSGEGGDEIFAGYDRYKASRIDGWYRRCVPGAVRRGLVGPLVTGLRDRPQKKGAVNFLKRFIEGSLLPTEGEHLRWQYFLNPDIAQRLFTPAFQHTLRMEPFRLVRAYSARCKTGDRLNRELYLDTRFMMTDSVLMKVDKMSMAHALEVRVPLLDHAFVEFNATLPGEWKLKGLTTKRIFRSALEGILPHDIVHRGKQGYSLPVKNLLRGRMKDYMVHLLNDSPLLREHCDMTFINRLIREHVCLTHNHNHVLWGLMNVAIWHNTFLTPRRGTP
jgi:asparagine synthase (glutamine-hydrolysing)